MSLVAPKKSSGTSRFWLFYGALADIAAYRILPECQGMTKRELSLLAEQDRIEYKIGVMDAADS